MHWAQPEQKIPMIQNKIGSITCKSEIQSEMCLELEYPRRFDGWISHNSPTIRAFRNYKI